MRTQVIRACARLSNTADIARRSIVVALLMVITGQHTLRAQVTVPVNLYVADLRYANGLIHVGTPHKLTADRGINSQPSFSPDGKSIFFVRRDSTAGQGDVYRIDLSTGVETRITSTPEMENSPTVTPDGKLMVIRWTPATLFREWGPWIYDMKGKPLRGVLPGPDTVGYYVRVDSVTFAMMRPKTRRAISIFDTRTNTMTDYDWIVANLPPQRIPGERAVSYTRTDSAGNNQLRRLDLVTHDTSAIAPTLPGRTVHAWTPRGFLLMGKANAIFALAPPRKSWILVASFADPELQDINTYVVSPAGDKLILTSPVRLAK
jgi:dipeptidyl aminopeptidase/acylaminoacyl peptidase